MTTIYRTVQIPATPHLHLVRVGALGLPRLDQADTLCGLSIARGFEHPLGTSATCDDCNRTCGRLMDPLSPDELAGLFTARYEVVTAGTNPMSDTLARQSMAHSTEPSMIGERDRNGGLILDDPMRLDMALLVLQAVRRHCDRYPDKARERTWRYNPEIDQGVYREGILVAARARYLRPVPAVQP